VSNNIAWWVVSRALRVCTVGVSLGALVALSSFVVSGMVDLAGIAGLVQWAVVILVPLLTWVIARNDLINTEGAVYRTPSSAYGRMLAVGIIGALLANLLYYTLLLYAPLAFKGFDALAWRPLVDQQLDWTRYAIAAIVAAVGAAAVGAWAQKQASAA
jgi:hypothetical protein